MVVYQEALTDQLEGRFADALEKHIWMHEHGLAPGSPYRGVALSFALSNWARLGELYRPAMEALERTAARAERAIRAGSDDGGVDRFREFVAINRTLDRPEVSADLFAWLDQNRAQYATEVYIFAQSELVQAGRYSLASRYLEPDVRAPRLARGYQAALEYNWTPSSRSRMLEGQRLSFVNGAATMVALLVVNGRIAEADAAMRVFRDMGAVRGLDEALEAARRGVIPETWPPR
jgi:hypothetical protein